MAVGFSGEESSMIHHRSARPEYCTFHISCPDSMSKREGISIVLVYQCKL